MGDAWLSDLPARTVSVHGDCTRELPPTQEARGGDQPALPYADAVLAVSEPLGPAS